MQVSRKRRRYPASQRPHKCSTSTQNSADNTETASIIEDSQDIVPQPRDQGGKFTHTTGIERLIELGDGTVQAVDMADTLRIVKES